MFKIRNIAIINQIINSQIPNLVSRNKGKMKFLDFTPMEKSEDETGRIFTAENMNNFVSIKIKRLPLVYIGLINKMQTFDHLPPYKNIVIYIFC